MRKIRKSSIAFEIRSALKLNESECKWIDGAVVINPQNNGELEIINDVSGVLKRYNNLKIKFTNCVFKKPIKLQQITFKEILYFMNSTFEGEVDFSCSLFEKRAFFSESTFKQKADFTEVIFEHNAYFDETTFKSEANFDESEFCRHARFYGTKFGKFPDFLQTIFDGCINLTNVEPVSIDGLEERIREVCEKRKAQGRESPECIIANELRDSFRAIKSALIKDNNMLDASHYEALEQRCKKIALEYKSSQNGDAEGA